MICKNEVVRLFLIFVEMFLCLLDIIVVYVFINVEVVVYLQFIGFIDYIIFYVDIFSVDNIQIF